jgi:hypothetical protein
MLGKIKKIQAEVSEKILNSGYFITILHTNSGNIFFAQGNFKFRRVEGVKQARSLALNFWGALLKI